MEGLHQYKCDRCQLLFDSLQLLIQHQNPATLISCSLCCSGFNNTLAYSQHLLSCHHTENEEAGKKSTCQICFKQFSNKYILKTHMAIHSRGRPYKCEDCNLTFRQQCHLNQHKALKGRKLQCSMCCASFHNYTYFNIHNTKVHNKKSKAQKPTKSANESDLMKVRKSVNTSNSKKVYSQPRLKPVKLKLYKDTYLDLYEKLEFPENRVRCKLCSAIVRNIYGHIASVHTNERPHICNICSRRFKLAATLKIHRATVHSNVRPYECKICSRKFKLEFQLKRHTDTVHSKLRPYECKICSRRFKREGQLKTHTVTVHSIRRPYECNICSRKFKLERQLKRHTVTIHSIVQPYECQICCRNFKLASTLRTHKATVHSNVWPFECKICCKRFSNGGNLKRHIATVHCNFRPYKCNICCRRFNQEGNLKRHIATVHSNVRQYECELCSRKFDAEGNLKRHIHFIHNKKRDKTSYVGAKCVLDKGKCKEIFQGKNHSRVQLADRMNCRFKYARKDRLSEYPLKCSFCFRKYKIQYQLDRHVELAHPQTLTASSSNTLHSEEVGTVSSEKVIPNTYTPVSPGISATDSSKTFYSEDQATNSFSKTANFEELPTNSSEAVNIDNPATVSSATSVSINKIKKEATITKTEDTLVDLIVISDDDSDAEGEATVQCVSCYKPFPPDRLNKSLCDECFKMFKLFKAFVKTTANT